MIVPHRYHFWGKAVHIFVYMCVCVCVCCLCFFFFFFFFFFFSSGGGGEGGGGWVGVTLLLFNDHLLDHNNGLSFTISLLSLVFRRYCRSTVTTFSIWVQNFRTSRNAVTPSSKVCNTFCFRMSLSEVWAYWKFNVSKLNMRIQPARRPQVSWLRKKADEMQSFADKKDMRKLLDALKIV